MKQSTELLIIGAGPFGLAMSAHCQYLSIDHLVVGKPMAFWKDHMPKGMYLRSGCDWHLDTRNVDTIERYLQTLGQTPAEVVPLSLSFYLSYVDWFQRQKQIQSIPSYIWQLDCGESGTNSFRAITDDGQKIEARHVVLAVGFTYFKHEPRNLVSRLPAGCFSHTCDCVDLAQLSKKRCLIIGGRQSAFECAALLAEAGADAVHVCYRHDSPAFAQSDWSWVDPLVEKMVDSPGWFQNFPADEREMLKQKFWEEGRLKIEPWLEARLMKDSIKRWPNTRVIACDQCPGGELLVKLDNDKQITVDHIILATGYQVDMNKLPFLARGNILNRLKVNNGFPVLDECLQTNIPGLFVTSMAASQDFGPFFAFTVSVRASAKIIGTVLAPTGKALDRNITGQ